MNAVDYWGVMVGLGLLATAFGVVGFVRYRERESTTLQRQTQLARELRDLAGDDEVRLAAVDEFSLTIYQRLFYASVVAPWIRSAAWALLGAVLAGAGALAVSPLDGTFATVVHVAAIVATGVFAVATLVYTGIALYHSATTPRVSFSDSYATEDTDPDAEGPASEVPDPDAGVSARSVD
ncbi:hypothetical protein GTC6_18611 [Gordonia terrae C-6]|uniref:Transmembrane protein n=1 Tax=Gordonia terrae C-6 TaxID=1316928 RepID=R7Y5J7_9ACTN|nr:hypothetical protein [Gordonia terrae]EON31255.1 hypothetical protein GTC6_18611 [Gordonia terrae C-6]